MTYATNKGTVVTHRTDNSVRQARSFLGFRKCTDTDNRPFWVMDVKERGAVLPHSVILDDEIDEAWELKADVVHEYLDFADCMTGEVSHPVTDMQQTEQVIDAQLENLGTRTIISGGEVLELDESLPDHWYHDNPNY